MVIINSFRGIRYNPEKVEDFESVVAPPYDVIGPEERKELYNKHPKNVIRLILPEGKGDKKYKNASDTFSKWLGEETLIRDDEPCIYPYTQEFDTDGETFMRRGFIAAVKLEDFASKNILPHEKTFPKPIEDRLKLTSACRANLSPVFAVYSDPEGRIEKEVKEAISSEEPLYRALGGDGVRNSVWKISDVQLISGIKSRMADRNLLIADGHHRYETALNYRKIRRNESGKQSEDEPYEFVMVYLSRAEDKGLIINPTHRIIKSLGSLDKEQFLHKLKDRFRIEAVPFSEGISDLDFHGELTIITGETDYVYKLTSRSTYSPNFRNLGVMLLHKFILDELLATDKPDILNTKHLEEVAQLVWSGKYELGFVLPPLRASDIFEVVLADEKLPQKTTYFYPKLLSGLVFHSLEKKQ